MTESSADHALARRAILKGASLGVGAGLVSAFTAHAQISAAGAAQASDGAIWSAEYWAKKGDVALNLWRKRGAPKSGRAAASASIPCARLLELRTLVL
jgi:Mn-containing catalase